MLLKKLFRTMWQYKAQFISMIIMTTLGIGIFLAFNIEWFSIDKNTNRFMEETGYADYRIISEKGFTNEDVEKLEDIYIKDNVTRYVSLESEVESGSESKGDSLSLSVIENSKCSSFLVKDGKKYNNQDENGIWISEKYAKTNNIRLEEQLDLVCNGIHINPIVKGFIQSSEHMICLQNETQVMPDYTTHGYSYISPAMFKKSFGYEFYPQIHVITNEEKSEFASNVNSKLEQTSMIITKEESIAYAGSQGEVKEGKLMGSMLPVIFLVISILTMITTMQRITRKEQSQIGTLKALGFKNRKILVHYISYAGIIGIFSNIFGIILGYLLVYTIINPNGPMGEFLDLPYWNLYMPDFAYIVLLIIFLLLIVVGILSVYKILKGTPAEILRNNQNQKIRIYKIEKSKWFHKRSFGTRWNIRDTLHHKARTLMSLIGVIGCIVILITSFGIQDTMNKFLDTSYNNSILYASKIFISKDTSKEKIEELTNVYGKDTSATVGIKIDDKAISLDIYNIENGLVKFLTSDEEPVTINDNGAYICKRVAEKYSLKVGDEFIISPYGKDTKYTLNVEDILCSITENIVISQKYADKLDLDYTINSIYTDKENIPLDDSIIATESKADLIDSFNSMVQIMDTMITMLIIVGLLLSIVVLYNLGVMGYAERYREMATLKVLGFKDKKISSLLISQNLWVSVIGTIIGIPLGYMTLSYLLIALASDYEMNLFISCKTYIISILLNLGVSLLVSIMVSKKNKDINMVEALKNDE